MNKLELSKLDLNKSFFDKEKFKKNPNIPPKKGYYYFKEIGNFLITFEPISNDKGVQSSNVCKCSIHVYINSIIAGYKLNKMPVKIRSLTVSKIIEEYEKIKDFLNTEPSKLIVA